MSERLYYLDAGGTQFLAAFHPATGAAAHTAVLFVPPFGWEDIASHRSRRMWAEDLAAHGYPVLRIDLPGTGDSAGGPEQPGQWADWNSAVTVAARRLRAEAGTQVVTAIGIGLGALLAYEAAARGDVDDLVLWAAPARGRSFVRELAAFSALETARIVEAGAPDPLPLPEGFLAPGGFIVSPETLMDLAAVDLTERELRSSTRVLALDRDGVKPDPKLSAAIVERGADLRVQSGAGYADMLTDPAFSLAPKDVFARTRAWLEEGRDTARASTEAPAADPPVADSLRFTGGRERPFFIDRPEGRLVGILVEPEPAVRGPVTAVFLNAGAIRRVGPHRLWVDAARRWALKGVTSLRLDLESIGDSEGPEELFGDVGRFHDERYVNQVRAALDALQAAGLGDRFIITGLCSGAYWAFQAALADTRIVAALMLNPRVLYWDEQLEISRDLRRARLLVKPVTWRRLMRGEVPFARWVTMTRWLLGSPVRVVRALGARAEMPVRLEDLIATAFDVLRDREVRARFVFCDGEPLYDELTSAGLLSDQKRWPLVSVRHVPGRDHTLRPLWMHEHVVAAMDGVIDGELARFEAPAVPSSGDVVRQG